MFWGAFLQRALFQHPTIGRHSDPVALQGQGPRCIAQRTKPAGPGRRDMTKHRTKHAAPARNTAQKAQHSLLTIGC